MLGGSGGSYGNAAADKEAEQRRQAWLLVCSLNVVTALCHVYTLWHWGTTLWPAVAVALSLACIWIKSNILTERKARAGSGSRSTKPKMSGAETFVENIHNIVAFACVYVFVCSLLAMAFHKSGPLSHVVAWVLRGIGGVGSVACWCALRLSPAAVSAIARPVRRLVQQVSQSPCALVPAQRYPTRVHVHAHDQCRGDRPRQDALIALCRSDSKKLNAAQSDSLWLPALRGYASQFCVWSCFQTSTL